MGYCQCENCGCDHTVGFCDPNTVAAYQKRVSTERLQSIFNVLMEIRKERLRQEDLKAAGRFRFTCADRELTNAERFVILSEEVGEVARAIQERAKMVSDVHNVDLRKELIQVAAIALAFVQGLDAEKAP